VWVLTLLLIGVLVSEVNDAITSANSRALTEELQRSVDAEKRRSERLQRSLDRFNDFAECAVRFDLAVTDAEVQWNLMMGILVIEIASARPDLADEIANIGAVNQMLAQAFNERLRYQESPVLPCPIAAPEPSEGN
jgi:hypothetical protein